MRRAWRFAALAVLVAGALGASVAACFKPDHPACAFTCIDPPHSCPAGYTCGDDNLCHDPNNPGICDLAVPIDGAAPEAGALDAGPNPQPDASPDSRSQ
jgi:hypothetical protein